MNYNTSTIPATLAEKLKEKGMPNIDIDCDTFDSGTQDQREERWCNNTYAEVFDWLMSEKEIEISFVHHFRATTIAGTMETSHEYYHTNISMLNGGLICYEMGNTWHEAANAAIEKALTLI